MRGVIVVPTQRNEAHHSLANEEAGPRKVKTKGGVERLRL